MRSKRPPPGWPILMQDLTLPRKDNSTVSIYSGDGVNICHSAGSREQAQAARVAVSSPWRTVVTQAVLASTTWNSYMKNNMQDSTLDPPNVTLSCLYFQNLGNGRNEKSEKWRGSWLEMIIFCWPFLCRSRSQWQQLTYERRLMRDRGARLISMPLTPILMV
jgi:hypothetical protein